jgi:hypothetical protein
MPSVANVSVTATLNAEAIPGARPHEGRARSRISAFFDLNDGVGSQATSRAAISRATQSLPGYVPLSVSISCTTPAIPSWCAKTG